MSEKGILPKPPGVVGGILSVRSFAAPKKWENIVVESCGFGDGLLRKLSLFL